MKDGLERKKRLKEGNSASMRGEGSNQATGEGGREKQLTRPISRRQD